MSVGEVASWAGRPGRWSKCLVRRFQRGAEHSSSVDSPIVPTSLYTIRESFRYTLKSHPDGYWDSRQCLRDTYETQYDWV